MVAHFRFAHGVGDQFQIAHRLTNRDLGLPAIYQASEQPAPTLPRCGDGQQVDILTYQHMLELCGSIQQAGIIPPIRLILGRSEAIDALAAQPIGDGCWNMMVHIVTQHELRPPLRLKSGTKSRVGVCCQKFRLTLKTRFDLLIHFRLVVKVECQSAVDLPKLEGGILSLDFLGVPVMGQVVQDDFNNLNLGTRNHGLSVEGGLNVWINHAQHSQIIAQATAANVNGKAQRVVNPYQFFFMFLASIVAKHNTNNSPPIIQNL